MFSLEIHNISVLYQMKEYENVYTDPDTDPKWILMQIPFLSR